ncbi:hypothetical protein [Rothia nasimurium]|uniref:hypothetical protein n=1 Tax=Rothia nasimurium TaxID=85336 RepID=UPI003BA39CEE
MNRSVRLAPVFLALLFAGLLVALLAVGFLSQRKTEQVRADLLDQSTMAAQLTALHLAADEAGQAELSQAAQGALESLATAAQEVTVTEFEPVEQQLQSTASALLEVGFSTQDAGDRARALTAVIDLWQAAHQGGLTEQAYPDALSDEVERIRNFSCSSEKLPLEETTSAAGEQVAQPASLLPFQQSIYQLNYVSEVYAARADQGYADVAAQAGQLAEATTAMEHLATPLFTCYGVLEAPAASYPVEDAASASQQISEFTAALEANARAVLADQALAPAADDLEALALILALDVQQLPR